MKIGELARQTSTKVVTIRYYEKEGLLKEPQRGSNNYRLYDEEDVERLCFIRHCRALGMSLDEVRQLLRFKEQPEEDCTNLNALLDSHLASLDRHITDVLHLKEHLSRLKEACHGTGPVSSCGIMKKLTAALSDCRLKECALCRHADSPNASAVKKSLPLAR